MASNIIRRPDRAAGGITDAERAAMAEHTKRWIANAMRTDHADSQEVGDAIRALYRAANLDEPRVVLVPSPRVMAFAGGFASAIWYLREHSGKLIDAATDAATRDATADATCAATRDATRAATRAATYDATYDATYAATYAATDAATRDATDAATDAISFLALSRIILGSHATFGIECAMRWYSSYQGGNMWPSLDCYLTAARDILGLDLPQHEKYSVWERAAKCGGFRLMHKKFCIVSDFPERLCVDAQNRPHSEDGPSHRWRDGWELWYWHGVRVTEQIVMCSETLTVQQIEAESNAEVRRVMIERFGTERYIRESRAECVHSLPDNYYVKGLRNAKLYRKSRPEDSDIVMIAVQNSTPEPDGSIKEYMLRVDPTAYDGEAARNCHAAMASTWRNRSDNSLYFKRWQEYAPGFES